MVDTEPAPVGVRVDGARVVMVADRLPVEWQPAGGWRRSPGGLVSAVDGVVAQRRCAWIGYTPVPDAGSPPQWSRGRLDRVDVPDWLHERAVAGYANRVLWPILHGFSGSSSGAAWADYVDYNRAVADHVHAVVGAGSLVWVHDYQLFLVPGLLRSRGSAVRIGLSVHTPFDLSGLDDIAAEAIGESLRACDVVGVQTDADLHALREFVATDSVGFVSPVSIDVGLVEAIAGETATRALGARELARARGRTLIVGVDRLDYTKAVVERLSGYDEAFARGILRPDDVQIVQVAQPTRTTIPEYRDLRLYAERLAHSLNARWARSDGTSPVELRTESLDRRHVMGLLAVADVCMVVPHRDGMNLVAKEFSIVNEASGGVLVLGRGAGAHDELGSASVSVEAATPGAIAASLREALSLQAQRRRAMAADRASAVRRWDASRWSDDFLGRLAGV